MANKQLVSFIKEARRRGFSDSEIKEPLLLKGWDANEIERAFSVIKLNLKYKNKVCFYLGGEAYKLLEKRAKKNLLTIEEQVEDIVRRSCVNTKNIKKSEEKLDDLLVSIFSRKNTGRKSSK